MAQLNGKVLGSNAAQVVAASLVAQALRVPLSTLRLPKACGVMEKHQQHVARCQQLSCVYLGCNPMEPKVPGDLAYLFRQGRLPFLSSHGAGLVVPFLLAKYALHRDAVKAAWTEFSPKSSKSPKEVDPVEVAYTVLRGALHKLQGKPLSQAWLDNVGRNTTHHSGLITFAKHSLGMLRPVGANAGRAEVLRFGQGNCPVKLEALTPSLRQKLSTLVALGRALLACKAPKTVDGWACELEHFQRTVHAQDVCGFKSPEAYRTLWVARTWLIWRMRQERCRYLRLPAGHSVADFAKLFPDQNSWLLRLAGPRNISRHNITAEELFEKVGYNGPPELFSMFTCLWGDKDLRQQLHQLGPSWIPANLTLLRKAGCPVVVRNIRLFTSSRHRPQHEAGKGLHCGLAQALQQYEKEHGLVPHPRVLVALVLQQTEGQGA